jgi:hypothetical protein
MPAHAAQARVECGPCLRRVPITSPKCRSALDYARNTGRARVRAAASCPLCHDSSSCRPCQADTVGGTGSPPFLTGPSYAADLGRQFGVCRVRIGVVARPNDIPARCFPGGGLRTGLSGVPDRDLALRLLPNDLGPGRAVRLLLYVLDPRRLSRGDADGWLPHHPAWRLGPGQGSAASAG